MLATSPSRCDSAQGAAMGAGHEKARRVAGWEHLHNV